MIGESYSAGRFDTAPNRSLALVALVDKFESIEIESQPVVAMSKGFEGQGSGAQMVSISAFMDLP